jgi:hypothetical protein
MRGRGAMNLSIADALNRLARLDARAKAAPGQLGFDLTGGSAGSGGSTGRGGGQKCGKSWISPDKSCRLGAAIATQIAAGDAQRDGLIKKLKSYGVEFDPDELDEILTGDLGDMLEAQEMIAARKLRPANQAPYKPTPQVKAGVSAKPMTFNAGGDSSYDPAAEKKQAAGGLKYYRTQRGGQSKQNYFFRDRQAAEHWYADDNAKSDADIEVGTANRRGKEWQAEYRASYEGTRNMLRDVRDRELLDTVEAYAAAGRSSRGGTATDVRISGNMHSRPIREGTFGEQASSSVLSNPGRLDPGLAPKAKPEGLSATEAVTSKQQAQLARQQQAAAKAAGDQQGATAWRRPHCRANPRANRPCSASPNTTRRCHCSGSAMTAPIAPAAC